MGVAGSGVLPPVSGSSVSLSGQLIRFATVEDVKDCFNAYGTYEGARFRAWIERGGEVQQIDLPARRIML